MRRAHRIKTVAAGRAGEHLAQGAASGAAQDPKHPGSGAAAGAASAGLLGGLGAIASQLPRHMRWHMPHAVNWAIADLLHEHFGVDRLHAYLGSYLSGLGHLATYGAAQTGRISPQVGGVAGGQAEKYLTGATDHGQTQ